MANYPRGRTNPFGYLNVNDMKVSEVAEADRFRLSKEDYCNFVNMILNRYREDVRKDVVLEAEDMKKKVDEEIRPGLMQEIRELITGKTREEAEKAFTLEKRAEIRKEIEKEIAGAAPTAKQREQARNMVRELEVAALTSFRAASDIVDKEEESYEIEHQVRQIIWYGLWLTSIPILAFLHVAKGWSFEGLGWLAVLVTFIIALIVSSNTNSDYEAEHSRKLKNYRDCAKYCKIRAFEAKKVGAVEIDAANTKGDLVSIVKSVASEDSSIVLSASILEKARVRVRDEIATNMDPEQFMRVMDRESEFEEMEQTGPQKKLGA